VGGVGVISLRWRGRRWLMGVMYRCVCVRRIAIYIMNREHVGYVQTNAHVRVITAV
jgi:hypothetical protein